MKKHILVTGSTDGIGKLTATALASQQHHVYIHGRNATKVRQTVEEIKESSNNPNIEGFVTDLSDLKQTKNLSSEIMKRTKHLDVLINNAGIYHNKENNVGGLDARFVVNYLTPYILTLELASALKNSKNARIINLSSAAQAAVSLEALTGNKQISVGEGYAQSKLALTMWSNYLSKQWPEQTIIAVNPGSLLNTKMVQEAFGHHWSSAEKGANILVSLAIDDIHGNHSGDYFDNDNGTYSQAHPDIYNEAKQAQLIDATEKLLIAYE